MGVSQRKRDETWEITPRKETARPLRLPAAKASSAPSIWGGVYSDGVWGEEGIREGCEMKKIRRSWKYDVCGLLLSWVMEWLLRRKHFFEGTFKCSFLSCGFVEDGNPKTSIYFFAQELRHITVFAHFIRSSPETLS